MDVHLEHNVDKGMNKFAAKTPLFSSFLFSSLPLSTIHYTRGGQLRDSVASLLTA